MVTRSIYGAGRLIASALCCCALLSAAAALLPVTSAPRRDRSTRLGALPPEQGAPLLVALLSYPAFLVYKTTVAPGAARDGVEWTTERSDGETGEARIGRAPRWSRREVPDPPYVRVCVGQDCAKDGAADAWGLVRSLAPRGVGVVPVNCLGPCGKGPCALSYAAGPDPERRPTPQEDGDGFFGGGDAPPPPSVLPTGIVRPRRPRGRRKLNGGAVSTEIRTTEDARVLFRSMGYADGDMCGGRGYASLTAGEGEGIPYPAPDYEVCPSRRGPLDLSRLDRIVVQRFLYLAFFAWASGRRDLDGAADLVLNDGLPAVPIWVLGALFFAATQLLSTDPVVDTYIPSKDDQNRPVPYA